MLALSHAQGGTPIASFRNYKELYRYIVRHESLKASEGCPKAGQWRFRFFGDVSCLLRI